MNISRDKLAELVAKMRAQPSPAHQELKQTIPKEDAQTYTIEVNPNAPTFDGIHATDKYGNTIEYNAEQRRFIELARSGKSCVLIGAAGTGKTTCQKGVTTTLIQSGQAGLLEAGSHKYLASGSPGIVICAFTRRAVANIRKNVSADLQGNCITIHKLLEYEPVYYTVMNEDTGEERTKMSFEPRRNASNPLPDTIKVIVFEEGSMLGTALHQEVIDACPHNPQIIYLGDIQQLPPVFGPAILGFKLLELPVVELTEVYRQALESPIIALAHRILSGKGIKLAEFEKWKVPGKMTLHPWKKKIEAQWALNTAGMFFRNAFDAGGYDPEQDIILIPFNKSFGTGELNNMIANHLARKREAVTHQIIVGFKKFYLSEGDKVMYDKEDAVVLKIESNPAYYGALPMLPSKTLDYWGYDSALAEKSETDVKVDDVDFLLAQVSAGKNDDEERVKKSSHIVTLKMLDSDTEIRISAVGELNALALGYAITVHKSQGSEWRKVFFVCHQSHATMLQRELLYTAVTRAKEELYVICEPETFDKGIVSQRVKGNTLEEKAEFFKGKKERMDNEEKLV
jgi:exodeoxyribonuclease V alpha subunit